MTKIHIGVSACLLGNLVRFNGEHKRDRYIQLQLGQHFDFVSFCPEVGIGMGIPRKPIRLVETAKGIRAVEVDNPEKDFTDDLTAWAETQKVKLDKLSGFILKSKSPSCGMERVKLYHGQNATKQGVGLFARAVMENYPNLPVEEEGRLHDPVLRENFLERVFVYHRWQTMIQNGLSKKALLAFHQSHKFQLMAHNQVKYRELGQMLADLKGRLSIAVSEEYIRVCMETFKKRATRKSNTNVLMHLQGYLKKDLDEADKRSLIGAIERYRLGVEPLVVPITLLKHFFGKFPSEYVQSQHYLEPHPLELALRNQV